MTASATLASTAHGATRFSGSPQALLGRGQQAILFTDGEHCGAESSVDRFARMPWPADTERIVVVAQEAPHVVAWFGIREFPTVAIVRDGAVLALEASCDDAVCQQLLALAASRHPACLEGH